MEKKKNTRKKKETKKKEGEEWGGKATYRKGDTEATQEKRREVGAHALKKPRRWRAVDIGLWACLLLLASVSVYRVFYMLLWVCDMLEGKDTTWSETSDKSSETI